MGWEGCMWHTCITFLLTEVVGQVGFIYNWIIIIIDSDTHWSVNAMQCSEFLMISTAFLAAALMSSWESKLSMVFTACLMINFSASFISGSADLVEAESSFLFLLRLALPVPASRVRACFKRNSQHGTWKTASPFSFHFTVMVWIALFQPLGVAAFISTRASVVCNGARSHFRFEQNNLIVTENFNIFNRNVRQNLPLLIYTSNA